MTKPQLSKKSQTLLESLQPEAEELFTRLISYVQEEGLNIQVSDGFRSIEEQDYLYSIGRTRKGKKVTNARGGYSFHNFGYAIDFFIINPDGKASWDLRFFKTIWRIAQDHKLDQLGMEWSGNWKGSFQESCHFQLNKGSLEDLRKKAGIN